VILRTSDPKRGRKKEEKRKEKRGLVSKRAYKSYR
jgi:hypothetical protein